MGGGCGRCAVGGDWCAVACIYAFKFVRFSIRMCVHIEWIKGICVYFVLRLACWVLMYIYIYIHIRSVYMADVCGAISEQNATRRKHFCCAICIAIQFCSTHWQQQRTRAHLVLYFINRGDTTKVSVLSGKSERIKYNKYVIKFWVVTNTWYTFGPKTSMGTFLKLYIHSLNFHYFTSYLYTA